MNNSPTTTYHPRNSPHARNQFTETDNRGQNRYKINPCHLINQLFAKPKRLIRPELNHRVILRFVTPPPRPAKKQEYPLVSIRIERFDRTCPRYPFPRIGADSGEIQISNTRVYILLDGFIRGESLTLLTRIDQPVTQLPSPSPPVHTRVFVTDFQSPRNEYRDIKRENTGKKAKRKQAYFLAVEWTFVYENGFGRKPTTATSQPTRLSGSIEDR